MIHIRGLRKQYGAFEAVAGMDLDIEAGEVFALLGPNGAGKTTTLEILEGYRARSAGEVTVLGVDPAQGDAAWKARIGIVLQSTGAFEELTVEETVRHFADLYPRPQDPNKVIALVGLAEKRAVRGHALSGGQKRRLDIALGIIGDPELIFLDEPTTGLDPEARRQTWALVRELTAGGKTIVLTTHYLEEAEALADRVGIMAAGRLVEVGPPRELGGRQNAQARIQFRCMRTLNKDTLPLLDVQRVAEENGLITLFSHQPTRTITVLANWARQQGLEELPELTVSRPTLEETYLHTIAMHSRSQKEAS